MAVRPRAGRAIAHPGAHSRAATHARSSRADMGAVLVQHNTAAVATIATLAGAVCEPPRDSHKGACNTITHDLSAMARAPHDCSPDVVHVRTLRAAPTAPRTIVCAAASRGWGGKSPNRPSGPTLLQLH